MFFINKKPKQINKTMGCFDKLNMTKFTLTFRAPKEANAVLRMGQRRSCSTMKIEHTCSID